MNLENIALFCTIVRSGTLSAAARHIGTTPMVVSRRLAALEQEVGVRLMHRTTRSLSLTPEGEAFFPHALALLEVRDSALASLSGSGETLSGTLKVSAPNLMGHTLIVPLVAGLMADNPALNVDVTLSDGELDITALGLDVAVRMTPLPPSDLVAIRLAENPYVLCASPEYLSRFGVPSTLEQLLTHACLRLHTVTSWPFLVQGRAEQIRIRGRFSASTVEAVRSACLAGAGIGKLSFWDIRHQLAAGGLVPIFLSDGVPESLGIWAVVPTRKFVPVRVRAFIDALKAGLAQASLADFMPDNQVPGRDSFTAGEANQTIFP